MTNTYIDTYVIMPLNVSRDFKLENSVRFELLSWLKILILININNLDVVLDLKHAELFRYLMIVGLAKS